MKKQNVQKRHKEITERFEKGIEKLLERHPNIPDYFYEPSLKQKIIEEKMLAKITKPINFLKNPRNKQLQKQILYKETMSKGSSKQEKTHCFVPNMKQMVFQNFKEGKEYVKSVKLINRDSCLRRLKFVPPKTLEFEVLDVIYPGTNNTEIASGNSIEFKIGFKAESLKYYNDQLTIITENGFFHFDIFARPEKPIINIPSQFECKPCWFGNTSITSLIVKNKGGYSKFKVYLENNEKKYFAIDITSFELYKNHSQVISINFDSKEHKEQRSKLVIEDMYGNTYSSILYSEANIVDVKPYKFNGKELPPDKLSFFNTIFFEDCHNNKTYTKTMEFMNHSKNDTKYEWEIEGLEKDIQFDITPEKGTFKRKKKNYFTMVLTTNNAPQIYKFRLKQFLLDIPQTAIKGCKKSEGEKLSRNLNYEFEVYVNVVRKDFSLSYNSYKPVERSLVSSKHTFTVDLDYNSPTTDKLYIDTTEKDSTLDLSLISIVKRDNWEEVEETKKANYEITGPCTYTLTFAYSSEIPDCQTGKIKVYLENTVPLVFDFLVYFRTSEIEFKESIINLGILPLFSSFTVPISIINKDEIQSEVLLINESTISLTSPDIYSLDEGEFEPASFDLMNNDNNIKINQSKLSLEPNSITKTSFLISSDKEGKLERTILLESIRHLKNKFDPEQLEKCLYHKEKRVLKIIAYYEQPRFSLNKYAFDFEKSIVEKQYLVKNSNDPKLIHITNYNNFPIEWKIVPIHSDSLSNLKCNFCPLGGVLKPQTISRVKSDYMVLKLKDFEVSYKMIYKPYFPVKNKEKNSKKKKKRLKPWIDQDTLASDYLIFKYSFTKVRGVDIDFKLEEDGQKTSLSQIKVDSSIMEAIVKKLVITNFSDMSVNYSLTFKENASEQFEGEEIDIKPEITRNNNSKNQFVIKSGTRNSVSSGNNSQIRNSLINNRMSIFQKIALPDTALGYKDKKKYNFKNKNAKEIQDKNYYNDKCQKMLDRYNKDLLITINPKTGMIKPNQQLPVQIMFYADSPMFCLDELVFKTNNGLTHNFTTSLNFVGLPIGISENQIGLKIIDKSNFHLDFGDVIACEFPKPRQLKVINRSNRTIKVFAEIHKTFTNSEGDEFRLKLNLSDHKGKFLKLFFNTPEVEEKNFYLTKNELLIPPNAVIPLEVYFNPRVFPFNIGSEESILVLKIKKEDDILDSKISVRLTATKIKPKLQILNDDMDEEVYHFYKQPSTKLIDPQYILSDTNQINIKNFSKCKIGFLAELSGPFQFKQNERDTKAIQLLANEEKQIDIRFIGYDRKETARWPKQKETRVSGELKINYKNYYQSMVTNQENNPNFPDSTVVKLEGVLLRPKLSLILPNETQPANNFIVDFGTVHFKNKKSITVYIKNSSRAPAEFKIVEERQNEELNPFSFDCEKGTVSADTTHIDRLPTNKEYNYVKNMAKPIKISFKPVAKEQEHCFVFSLFCKHGIGQSFTVKGRSSITEDNLNRYG